MGVCVSAALRRSAGPAGASLCPPGLSLARARGTSHRPHLPEYWAPSARLAQPACPGQPEFTSQRSGIKKPIS